MTATVPSRARIVIIGGGVIGTSIAYHLVKGGERDVVVLEQTEIGGGTTWHAAGMVGRLRASSTFARMCDTSAKLYAGLEAETGEKVDWRQCGTLYVARNEERMFQYRRTGAMAQHLGIDVEMVGRQEAIDLFPFQRGDDLVGGLYIPDDGKVEPAGVARALAKGAQLGGATICEHARVTGLRVEHGRATGVVLDDGHVIEAEEIVLSGGMWSRDLAREYGITLPLAPVEHHYVDSNPIPGDIDMYPCTRDADGCTYYLTVHDKIRLGAFQAVTKAWQVDPVPYPFSFALLEEDWEHFEPPLEEGRHRLPILDEVGFERFVNGPESFTPDSNFLLGPAPNVPGIWIAAGMNSAGMAFGGGVGEALAAWIIEGYAPFDLSMVDPARFAPEQDNLAYLRERVTEALGTHYLMAYPNRELQTGRPLRTSPVHEPMARAGAWFGEKSGMERPNFFGDPGTRPEVEYSFGRQSWFENHQREHRAAREHVAVFDQSGFGKLDVAGPDALAVLNRLCANDVDVAPGQLVYTAMLDERGRFTSDLTVLRLADDRFRLITGTAQRIRDLWHVRRGAEGFACTVEDVTADTAVISVMGPKSRALLQPIMDVDLGNEAFPFGAVREAVINERALHAARVTYVGELGWELHIPAADARDVLWKVLSIEVDGQAALLAGHYAINSLRLEKAYRAWGHELSPDETPLEAGLGFAVAWDKPGGFSGRDALLAQREAGASALPKRLVGFRALDPELTLWGGERLWRDDQPLGYTTSAAYGHAVGGAVALGYARNPEGVSADWLQAGTYAVEVNGDRFAVEASLKPFYDPDRSRVLS
jgi:4-methylaminobutanoate oxidase (formaldehyde-forming)